MKSFKSSLDVDPKMKGIWKVNFVNRTSKKITIGIPISIIFVAIVIGT